MAKKSAGILVYRDTGKEVEFFLVHPGGPFWAKKDIGAWSIPKGEFDTEEPLDAAIREFEEETGSRLSGNFIELQPLKQKSGKMVYVWGLEGNIDETSITSNNFDIEWPPKSGNFQKYPEVDKAAWFNAAEAFDKIIPGQRGFIEQLLSFLDPARD